MNRRPPTVISGAINFIAVVKRKKGLGRQRRIPINVKSFLLFLDENQLKAFFLERIANRRTQRKAFAST